MTMRLLIPLLLLFFCSASQAALFADNDARDEIVKLRSYVKEQQDKRITDLQAKLDASDALRQALEQRIGVQETQTVNLLAQIDRLNSDISNLRGQLEVYSHEIELSQQRQRDLYADLDGRLRKLEAVGTAAANPVQTTAAAATGADASATAPAGGDGAAELQSYEAALDLSKSGRHKESIDAFGKFLDAYPSSKYAAAAQYWIGYAYFSQKNYKSAIDSQKVLIKTYPDSNKVPDAMYNIANSQIQLSDLKGARQTLRDVLAKYPLSEVAPLAKKRLAVLESIKSRN
ncbi:outer membrane protein assembly factor BamD [mine drainage metagenome]|uniref:Outer membrane protein assembly factor BamD n=1 Tax=mine drainage metagenome TaxID=410659 RepID=A0A1J5QXV1_9ZZZZ